MSGFSQRVSPNSLTSNICFKGACVLQHLCYTKRTEAEEPIFWPPDVKNQLIVKDPDAGKD